MSTDYSIWAFAYTRSHMPRDFFGGTLINSNTGMVRNPMVYSAVLGGPLGEAPTPIVIDTGMKGVDTPSGKKYENVEPPDVVLGKVGLDPATIETVILTHLHFDHAGNLDAFPNATFYVQRREYEGWKRVLERPGEIARDTRMWPLSSLMPSDIALLDRLVADGRVRFLDGNAEVAPGIVCHLAADTHTFGCQWVEVQTADGPYVIAGDCVYWYENIEKLWPPAYVQGDTWRLLDTYLEIRALLGDRNERIVPGHDPELFVRHPSWTQGVNQVAELHVARGDSSRQPN